MGFGEYKMTKRKFYGFIERQQLSEFLFTLRATIGGCMLAFKKSSLPYKELEELVNQLQDLKDRVRDGQQIRTLTQTEMETLERLYQTEAKDIK